MNWQSKPVSAYSEAEIYRLLTGLVVPRPIAFVSSISEDGHRNLAPFSFFTVVSTRPPIITISCDKRHGREIKDTVRNISSTREFVVNVVSEDIAWEMNQTSLDLAPEVDEFTFSGLHPNEETLAVRAPRVAESPAQFECRLFDQHVYGEWTLILGEIMAIHVRADVVDERLRVKFDNLAAVGRMAGELYCRTDNCYRLARDADSPDRELRAADS